MRCAFLLHLKQGMYDEYVNAHQDVPSDVLQAHTDAGITNYSIFINQPYIFGYFEAENVETTLKRLGDNPAMHRWWESTAHLVKTGEDGRPVFRQLEEAFRLD